MINALVEELNTTGVHDNFLSIGAHLAKTKYRDLCEDAENPITSDTTKAGLAVMLENTSRFMNSMDETTRAVAVGDFQKYAMPMVRAIFPELIANEIVSVQPMLGPVSLVFYMDMVYGTNKGKVKRGDTAFSSIARGPNNPSYSSSSIDEEYVTVGDGSDITVEVNLAFGPVVPGSVVVTDGVQVAVYNGNGGFTGDAQTGGSINYASGAIDNLKFRNDPASGASITASYRYDMEGNGNIPQMDLVLTHSPIQAISRKLRTNWSLEAAFNLRSLHGLEAEVELTAAVGAEIRHEIDREIILDLQRLAGAGSVFWSRDAYSNISYTEHKLSFIDALVTGSNLIHKVTGRGRATFIVCGESVATLIETLPGFVANPGVGSGMVKGAVRVGRLNGQWDVYKDPFYGDNNFLMGFKGGSFLEAGYVYAPYIPLYTTPTVVLDDFVARKGLATQYGKKAINPLFYVTGQIGTSAQLNARVGSTTLIDETLPFGSAQDLGLASGRGVFGV